MGQAQRTFLPDVNYYVPQMQAGGDLGQALNGRIEFGALVAANATVILNGHSIAAGSTEVSTFGAGFNTDIMGPYGRTVSVVASGAATSGVTIVGRDYLGQKVKESLTLNGAVAVVSKKAFKYIDRVEYGNTAATTINLGTGAAFGLPYTALKVLAEYVDNVSGSVGTFVAPSFVDPQTLVTADPRGLYTPSSAPNGTKKYEVDLEFTNVVNAKNNGGLHGIRHFFS